ncbi:MAG: AAA family ATPase, partial [Actinomyces sp.]|nr:AAA family ATPase [Actinomyces sp.]
MHLKTLTLRGFKSFASTTTLRLESGITCVVGPNGSGKSNVVDALAWVMGEQGAKTLRGAQMADVIFAGTSGRPALGRAQVELTIDNTDGVLAIDYSEVTISRTLFRGGASEYSINGAPARLLDVQELLSDTGMGRQMHVIVGQGQLDAILSSTPEERRGFIEEAAGVLKHRRRKDRALRKLADMDQNLVRVLDLTNEIHRQLKPLARQARAARRASAIQARVRDARARLLADDLVDLRGRLDVQADTDRIRAARREELEGQLSRARQELEGVEEEERAVNPRLEAVSSAWRELTTLHERLVATAMLARERVSSLSAPSSPLQGETPEEMERRAEEAGHEDADLLAAVDGARTALQRASTARTRAEAEEEGSARELAQVNRVLADHREKVARLTGDVSAARSRLAAARAASARAQEMHRAALARQAQAEEAAAAAPTPAASEEDSAARAHQVASATRDAARAQVDRLLAEEREARTQRARWEARRDTLAESLTPEDATAGLAQRPGVLGELPDFVQVEAGWEDAASALLAPFADAAVVESVGTALELLREARSRGEGRVRMVVPDPDP